VAGFVDETLRDGPQSLWATRMKTAYMLGATPWIDRGGFRKVCVTSAAAFETAVKFLRDDPWERLRLLARHMPHAVIDVLIRSRNLFGWGRYPDEVVALVFGCLKRSGTQWVKVFDGLNQIRNIAAHFSIAREVGLKTSGMLSFSISPVHTDAHYAAKAVELIGCGVDSITLADPAGILTAARARTLFAALKTAIAGRVPIEFIAHDCMGLAYEAHREALLAGVDTVATAAEPLAHGESLPSTLGIVRLARELGVSVDLDLDAVRHVDDYFHWVAWKEGHAVPEPVAFDRARYEAFVGHQIPGGMMSNFRHQLRELGMLERIDEVLEESSRVRAELGYPIMVTPYSQFVGVQATLNVVQGERYKTVPEGVYLYARGHYGAPAAPIEPNVLDRILAGRPAAPIDHEALFGERVLDAYRRTHGPFASDEDLLLHLFFGAEHVRALGQQRSVFRGAPADRQPLRVLVEELAATAGLRSIELQKAGVRLGMRFF
jgi:oxaloacetate decarboxylase alpha subunit